MDFLELKIAGLSQSKILLKYRCSSSALAILPLSPSL